MTQVTLHIYDAFGDDSIAGLNKALRAVGTGAFHAAVEIHGQEWSYGYTEDGTGVFSCTPKGCSQHKYRESIEMGETTLSHADFGDLLNRLQGEWPGEGYDLLRRNCCTFCDVLCVELGVGNIPRWVINLSGAGATVQDGFQKASDTAQAAAIIAKAKAGDIDEKYQVTTKVAHGVQELRQRASVTAASLSQATKEFNTKHRVSERAGEQATAAGAVAQSAAKSVSIAAQDLDKKHNLSGKAAGAATAAADGAKNMFAKFKSGAEKK